MNREVRRIAENRKGRQIGGPQRAIEKKEITSTEFPEGRNTISTERTPWHPNGGINQQYNVSLRSSLPAPKRLSRTLGWVNLSSDPIGRQWFWSHHNSMSFSPMQLSISEKVVSNPRLAGGSLQTLQLPPPPKTDNPYPPLLLLHSCLLYTSPSPRDLSTSRMPSSA